MKYLRKDGRMKFHNIVLLLLLCFDSGFAQLCNPLHEGDNKAKFCTDSSTSGNTIFLISGAPTLETVHSCTCKLDIDTPVESISISYTAGNAMDNCGVIIKTDKGADPFTCASEDLVVQTLETIEFSRSTTVETHFCLEISLGSQTNSTITVTCTIDRRDNSATATHVTTTDDQKGHSMSTAATRHTTDNTRSATRKEGEDKPADSTETSAANDNSAIIGGAVGGGVAVLLLIFVVVIFICLRKRRRSKEDGKRNQSVNENKLNIEEKDKRLELDNATFEKKKTDDDLVVTYNDMYNMETVSDCEKNAVKFDKEIQSEKQRTNEYIVITDNVMYNVDTMHPRNEHYSVPNLTDPSTDSQIGEARVSQIYHEIESSSPVTKEFNTELEHTCA